MHSKVELYIDKQYSLIYTYIYGEECDMTLEETIRAAENGDTKSMIALGNYYIDEEEYKEAYQWFKNASDAGSLMGLFSAMRMARILGTLYEDLDDEQALNYRLDALVRCMTIMQCSGEGELIKTAKNEAFASYRTIEYEAATSFYELKKYQKAIDMVQSSADDGDVPARILVGQCHFKLGSLAGRDGDTQAFSTELETAYHYLKDIEGNTPIEGVSSKYAHFALFSLAILYRERVGLNIPFDIERSYYCLKQARSLPDMPPEAYQQLDKELSKYHKGIMGGLSYRG